MYNQIQTWIFRAISTFLAAIVSIVIIFSVIPGDNASAQIFAPELRTKNTESLEPPKPSICTIDNKPQTRDESLWNAAQAEEDDTLTTLKSLVNIDTGTGDEEGLKQIADLLEAKLTNIGMEVEKVESRDGVVGEIIVGTLEGSKQDGKKVLLIAHMDTVYERGTVEKSPFDIVTNKKGQEEAIGPGVADDKSGIAVIIHSLKLLIPRLNKQDFGKITVLINTDEEKGSKGSSWKIKELAEKSDVIFSYEPTQFLPDQFSDTELISEGLSGIKTFVATVEGKSAHAGANPELGVNALVVASDFVMQTKGLDQGSGNLRFNWTILESGKVSNVIPDKAEITADVRYPNKTALEATETELKKIAEDMSSPEKPIISIKEATNKGGRPPFQVTKAGGCRLIQNATDIYKSVGGKIELIGMTGGGSDAGFASESGKPVIEGLGLPGYGYHTGSQEGIRIEAIPRRLYLSAKMIMNEATGQ